MALATLAIYFLRKIAPVVSLSVVYLPAVLLVSTYWGMALGLLTSLLSAASFNFFHIPPTGQFTIVDSRNWVALAAFTIVALFASALAELARSRAQEAERRRAEADLAAALAHELLLGEDTQAALASAARRVAEALGLTSAAIEPTPDAPRHWIRTAPSPRRRIRGGWRCRSAASTVRRWRPCSSPPTCRRTPSSACARRSYRRSRRSWRSPSAATRCRPSWSRPAALRRSDDIKTALLRAVSHDLRTPLTAVVAAGHALGADSLTDQERSELQHRGRRGGHPPGGTGRQAARPVAAAGRQRHAAL